MRIGIVLPSVPAYSETFFNTKIKGLQEQGHTVLLFINPGTEIPNSRYKVIQLPKVSGSRLQIIRNSLFCLSKAIVFHFPTVCKLYQLDTKDNISFSKKLKNSIVNSVFYGHNLDWIHFGYGTLAIGKENVAEAIGAKMGVSFRGFDIGIYPLKNKKCYNLLWEKVDKVHVISDDIKNLVLINGFKYENKIVKICPAIDTSFFSNSSIEKTSNQIPQLITVARLNWKKGLEYTLEALFILKEKGIRFYFTIIGDGKEFEKLKFAVNQLKLTNQVSFLGKLSATEVKNKLESADLYIQYSLQEGFCNAVLEAQAMGKICIVSDAEGLTENVVDGITGFVVPKGNSVALAKKIKDVLALSLEQKNTISKNAIERVQTNFNSINQQKKWLTFFN